MPNNAVELLSLVVLNNGHSGGTVFIALFRKVLRLKLRFHVSWAPRNAALGTSTLI